MYTAALLKFQYPLPYTAMVFAHAHLILAMILPVSEVLHTDYSLSVSA